MWGSVRVLWQVKVDLMNQMREKSQSQQLARSLAEGEWTEQKVTGGRRESPIKGYWS